MKEFIDKLKNKGILFDKGLTNEEIEKIENIYEIKFPEKLKEFYKMGVPTGERFYKWNDFSNENIEYIKENLNRPLDEIRIEIENEGYWVEKWGEFDNVDDRLVRFDSIINDFPKLIPIYSHRYVVCGNDNPAVLSVMGSDIIVYGNNLEDYFSNDFLDKDLPTDYLEYMGKWIDVMENY